MFIAGCTVATVGGAAACYGIAKRFLRADDEVVHVTYPATKQYASDEMQLDAESLAKAFDNTDYGETLLEGVERVFELVQSSEGRNPFATNIQALPADAFRARRHVRKVLESMERHGRRRGSTTQLAAAKQFEPIISDGLDNALHNIGLNVSIAMEKSKY